MYLASTASLSFLSFRSGVSKTGRSWGLVDCHDDRGTVYRFFCSETIDFDIINGLSTGDVFYPLFDVQPSFDGRSFRLYIQDIKTK